MRTAPKPAAHSFISGGYFLAIPAPRSEPMNGALLPDRILTASDCLVDLAPNTWGIAWTRDTIESRREAAAKFGLNEQALRELMDWSTAAIDSGSLGWPNVFLDVATAIHFRTSFLPASTDTVVFGIALPADLRDEFLEGLRPGPQEGTPGVVRALEANVMQDEQGSLLGFDVLGWDHGGFHSYICNGLETEFQQALGLTPNAHGFFATEQEARRCAEHAGLETTGAEPALWLPWRVIRYER
jgi:hypothetical protein